MAAKKNSAVIFKTILGLVFLTLGIIAILNWWQDFKIVIKGCIGLCVILLGMITLILARE
jgi:hypothetical protein